MRKSLNEAALRDELLHDDDAGWIRTRQEASDYAEIVREVHSAALDFDPAPNGDAARLERFDADEPTAQQKLYVRQFSDELVSELARRPELMQSMDWRVFEQLIAEVYERMGCRVELTAPTKDGGRDVLAWVDAPEGPLLSVIETKRNAPDRPVGVEIVRALYGVVMSEGANRGVLVTTSYFSPDARQFSKQATRHNDLVLKLSDFEALTALVRRASNRKRA